jgi:hypothetical protein
VYRLTEIVWFFDCEYNDDKSLDFAWNWCISSPAHSMLMCLGKHHRNDVGLDETTDLSRSFLFF